MKDRSHVPLLPQPQKPKPNLHLYDESCVEIIGFIKYLQKNFDCSLSEIKTIADEGGLNFENGFERGAKIFTVPGGTSQSLGWVHDYHLFETILCHVICRSEHECLVNFGDWVH